MRYQKLGWGAVCAVLVIRCVISSSTFEAAHAGASTAKSQTAGEKPVGSGMPLAVIRGKIRFTGTAPAPNALNMSADPACMQFFKTSEDVRVSDQGLENVMVYVSSPVATSVPIGSAVTLDQRDCRFDPHVLTARAGQTLIVRNSDNTLENVHAFTQVNAPFNIGLPVPMATSHIFDKPEAQIPIHDDVHRWKSVYVEFSITPATPFQRRGDSMNCSCLPAVMKSRHGTRNTVCFGRPLSSSQPTTPRSISSITCLEFLRVRQSRPRKQRRRFYHPTRREWRERVQSRPSVSRQSPSLLPSAPDSQTLAPQTWW